MSPCLVHFDALHLHAFPFPQNQEPLQIASSESLQVFDLRPGFQHCMSSSSSVQEPFVKSALQVISMKCKPIDKFALRISPRKDFAFFKPQKIPCDEFTICDTVYCRITGSAATVED